MKKPVIGIVGRESILKEEVKPIFLVGDMYRRAVIKARWSTSFNFTNSRFRIFIL